MQSHDARIDNALAYPFDIPATPYFFLGGHCYPLIDFDPNRPNVASVRVYGGSLPAGELVPGLNDWEFVPVLASGSNASASRLSRKLSKIPEKERVVLVATGWATGISAVYSSHFTSYGSIPTTLIPSSHTRLRIHCTFLPRRLLEILHYSENLGRSPPTLPSSRI